jgi:cytochrome c5
LEPEASGVHREWGLALLACGDAAGARGHLERWRAHETGKDGAPKLGDIDAWKPRLAKGVDPLVKSAINGHNAMPARGGLADLSDAEMKSAVIHMVNQIAAPKK